MRHAGADADGVMAAERRIGIIVATHGDLARSLVETAGLILGRQTELEPFAFGAEERAEEASARLQALVRRSERGAGVLILADLFGGTPGSLALSMLESGSVEVVTGVNLPMVVAAASLENGLSVEQAGERVIEAGREAIMSAGRMLQS